MENNLIPVESIQERDVDLILLEELSTDFTFCEWFIKELSLPPLTSINGAWKSISDFGLGETDILFSYFSYEKKIFVLIENKLDANFQYEQYDRYKSRANKYLNNKKCDISYCILTAPKLYCENQNEFDNYLTYESIADRLELIGSKRSLFKSKLLRIGSEKLRRGYQPVNSVPVQSFWHSYWHFKEKFYPQFYMKKPGIVPHNSDWPILFEERLPNIVFYHKLAQGNVDANFRGYDEETEFKIKVVLPSWIRIEKHGKTFSLRIFSGKLDRFSDFNSQIDTVKRGLDMMLKLRNWIIGNKELIQLKSREFTSYAKSE